MTDTIELLEAIGSDASLRYAAADELKEVLDRAQASDELAAAVVSGDGASLRIELGIRQAPQAPQTNAPGYGDDELEDDIPLPERHTPDLPPAPSREGGVSR